MKKLVFAVIIFPVFLSLYFGCVLNKSLNKKENIHQIPENFIEITDTCYLEKSSTPDYATLHFKGEKYINQGYIKVVYLKVLSIDGVATVHPSVYSWALIKGALYNWDEIVPQIKNAIESTPIPEAQPQLQREPEIDKRYGI